MLQQANVVRDSPASSPIIQVWTAALYQQLGWRPTWWRYKFFICKLICIWQFKSVRFKFKAAGRWGFNLVRMIVTPWRQHFHELHFNPI